MRGKVLSITLAFVFIMFSAASFNYAQKMSFSPNIGISKLMGNNSEYWNIGFSYGGNGFYYLTSHILIGGRIVYNRFTPNKNEIIRDFSNIEGLRDWDISGSATIMEFVPSLRLLAPKTKSQSINIFGHLGVGLFLANLDATVKASYMGHTYEESIARSENKLGLSLGGGILIGKAKCMLIEILPLYHIIFTKEETMSYFSFSIGIGCTR